MRKIKNNLVLIFFLFVFFYTFVHVRVCDAERISAKYSLNGIPYFFIDDIPPGGSLLNPQIGVQLVTKNITQNNANLSFFSKRLGYAIAIRGNLNVIPVLGDPTTYKEVYLIAPHSPMVFFSNLLPTRWHHTIVSQYKVITEDNYVQAYSPSVSNVTEISNVKFGPCDGDAIYIQYNSLETSVLDLVMMVLGIIKIGELSNNTGNDSNLTISFIKFLLTNPNFMSNIGLKIYAGEPIIDILSYLADPTNIYSIPNMFWNFVKINPNKVVNTTLFNQLLTNKYSDFVKVFASQYSLLLVPKIVATGLTLVQTTIQNVNDVKPSGYVISLSSPATLQSCLTPFPDIKKNDWYADYVAFLASKGIVQGKQDNLYHPADYVTRAEFLKMALIAKYGTIATFDWNKYTPTTKPFNDVDIYEWYAPFINFAKQKNIVVGFSDGSFKPNQYISRAEAASIIVKVFSMSWGSSAPPVYTDVTYSISNPIYIASSNMASYAYGNRQRIFNGYKDGSFKPNNQINRAEAAKILVLSMLATRR